MQAIDTQDNQFHDGNGTTELGTILPAWWLNQIQAEILAVLTAAKVVPNKAHTNQMLNSINKLIAGAVVNNLTSSNADKPLSALQGKVLSEQIAAAVAGGFALRGSLGSRNLNDVIGAENYGVWGNSANSNATTAKNYPAIKAGTLFLLPSAYQGVQLYIPFDLNIIYIRHSLSNDNNNWSSWRIIDETINALNSDSRTAALSAAMGKKLNDEKLGNSGTQTLNGNLHIVRNSWEKLRFVNADGSYWRYETNPNAMTGSNGKRFNFVFTGTDSTEQARVAFPDPNGTQAVAYQSWVNENIENKDFLKTINFADVASATYTKSGFYRGNGKRINDVATPSMEIHIAHPSYTNNAYARGIGFGYGGSFALTTTSWDKDGNYLGQKAILTEENGVMLSGNQTINGTKTFSGALNANGGVQISGTNAGYFEIKRGTSDFYLRNRISGKYVQFKDDGVLAYNGNVEVSGNLKTQSEINAGGLISTSYRNDWVGFLAKQPTEGKGGFFDVVVNNVIRGGLQIATESDNRYFARLMVTPAGATNADRRVAGMTVYDTAIHTYAYGWLHEGFVRAGNGIGQNAGHQVKIGWNGRDRLKATIDNTDLGNLVFDQQLNTKSTVAVLTGKVAHGGTIPLPAGFTQAQCKWIVSMNNENPTSVTWDLQEAGAHNHYSTNVWADANRVVHCRVYRYGTGGATGWNNAEANYMIIGVK